MSHQRPLNSGFNAGSTTTDVLAGQDLSGKFAIVTGGYSGLGLATSKALVEAGARVLVTARRPDVARSHLATPMRIDVQALDLTEPGDIRRFADEFLAAKQQVDYVIANAGIMAAPEARVGAGWESQFATNHLGHYALINRLLPSVKEGGRVVVVSSAGHHLSAIRWDDPHFHSGYDKWLAYGQSKTANALFAVQFDQLAKERGIRAFSLHPGKIFTPLQRHLTQAEMIAAGWLDQKGNPADPTFKTVEQGAATQVWAATSPQLQGIGGVYCEDCDIAPLAEKPGTFEGVCAYAIDAEQAQRLWTLSRKLTGVDAFA